MDALLALLAKGGLIMIPLLVSSVVALAVVLERCWYWRRLREGSLGTTLLDLVAEGQYAQASQAARASRHPLARVFEAGLEHRQLTPRTAMEAAAYDELQHCARYLPVLDTIITLAPLLGLLGTVTGMISAFGIVSDTGLGQPHAVTGGVAEALIATATGLFIAIATLLPYNYFQAAVERLSKRLETGATRLELLLQRQEV